MSFQIPKNPTGQITDGAFASEAVDTSGEVVSISGMDVSSMEAGEATANSEHLGDDSGKPAQTTVGKVVYVHKVLTADDCEDDRQRLFWKRVGKVPYLYGVVRLYDGAGHPEAVSIAAQIRDHVANKEPVIMRFSIEGSTLDKDGNHIKSSIARRVAMTIKPANKTAVSGLLADPNAPAGFDKGGDGLTKFERDPMFQILSGFETSYVPFAAEPAQSAEDSLIRVVAGARVLDALLKAETAGSYDAAPSSLTGGAALQREDLKKPDRSERAQVLAALRDYPGAYERRKFRAFAKAKLPEVSEDFLDHFADMAEAFHLAKHVKGTAPLPTEAKGRSTVEDLTDEEESDPPEFIREGGGTRVLDQGTRRGVPVGAPKAGLGASPVFDAEKGILHTPIGSFPAYLPKHDGPLAHRNYQKLLSDSGIEKALDVATTNWMKHHKALKAGKTPPEVLMHAVMFSQLSPNTPVPTQELQFARLYDAMKRTGMDPRKPGFGAIVPEIRAEDHPDKVPSIASETFAKEPRYRQGNKVGVDRDLFGNKVGEPGPGSGRYPGELLGVGPLLNNKMASVAKYHTVHDRLTDLMHRHRHDMIGAIGELMQQKHAAGLRDANAGGQQPLDVPGIKVKTGLYTWGMLGGGNSVVPDTHFIRNMFGLDVKKDKDTLSYLKNLLWRPSNMHVLKGYNQWYLKNHPAVAYTLKHPKFGKQFSKPEDAIFPSFWRHWLTIRPHEHFLGQGNHSEMAGTSHEPYWAAVNPLLKKGETPDFDSTLPLRTAMIHQRYARHYGEVPAMMLYYKHLAPELLDAAQRRERTASGFAFLAKANAFESAAVELRKAVSEAMEPEPTPAPVVRRVSVNVDGKPRVLGRYAIHNGQVHHLEDYYGALGKLLPEGPVNADRIARMHGLAWAPHLSVEDHHPDLGGGGPPDPLLEDAADEPPPRPGVFHYLRAGMTKPAVLEFGKGGAALDGSKLDEAELSLLHDNARRGLASVRWVPNPPVQLGKAEPPALDPGDALAHVRAAVAAGHIHPDVERALTRHIYEDPMAQGVGNRYAYRRFREEGRPGVYVGTDNNGLKTINDTFGHDAGDEAIRGSFSALRDAAAKVGTGKLFRTGGDEGAAWFPTYEDASVFLRHARNHLDQLPPIRGTHKVSVAFGLGKDFGDADRALYQAKAKKVDPVTGGAAYPVGRTPHLAHSMFPGTEGPVEMHSERPPVEAPKLQDTRRQI